MSISTVYYDKNGKQKRKGNYAHVKSYRAKKRRLLIDEAGGQCQICKYNTCIRNLHFHHIDPSQKEFGLSTVGNGLSLEKARIEMKKCMLVCSNCHGEIHDKILDISDYKPCVN